MRDAVVDANALLEMGATMIDAGTVVGLLARIAELERDRDLALQQVMDVERERAQWQESHEHHEAMRVKEMAQLATAEATIAKARELAAKWRAKSSPEERGYAENYLGDCADELEATLKGGVV